MIPILLLLAIFILELLFFKQRSLSKTKFGTLLSLNLDLQILKALSYLPSSKLEKFEEVITEFSTLLKKEQYHSFKLILLKKAKLELAYPSGMKLTKDENTLLANLEQISQRQITSQSGLILVPLLYQQDNLGYFLLGSNKELNAQETEFLNVVAGILTLIIRRMNFNQSLSFADQLKALNVKW